MEFKYRLAYYLLGVLIGGVFLMFIFQNKNAEFCYMPNCRVLKNIKSKGLVFSVEAKKKFAEKWVTPEDIHNSLKDGDVDFGKSNKPGNGGKLYVIESVTAKNEPIIIEIINGSEAATVKDIKKQ